MAKYRMVDLGGSEFGDPRRRAKRDPDTVDRKYAVLRRLGQLNARAEAINHDLNDAALAARGEGASWAEIGSALGVSPQAAYQRWSDSGRAKHAERQRNRKSGDARFSPKTVSDPDTPIIAISPDSGHDRE